MKEKIIYSQGVHKCTTKLIVNCVNDGVNITHHSLLVS